MYIIDKLEMHNNYNNINYNHKPTINNNNNNIIIYNHINNYNHNNKDL